MKSAKKLSEKLSKIVSSKNEGMTPDEWEKECIASIRKAMDKARIKSRSVVGRKELELFIETIITIMVDMGAEMPRELVEFFDDLKSIAKKATEDLQELDFE